MDWFHAGWQKNSATLAEHCRVHKRFSTWINILCVGTPNISSNGIFEIAAPPPLSAHHTGIPNTPDNNLLQSKLTRETVICYFTNQQTNHPTGGRLPDHSYKLCQVTNCITGSPAKALDKSWPIQAPDSIPLLNQKE
jgi:hypothetical protein